MSQSQNRLRISLNKDEQSDLTTGDDLCQTSRADIISSEDHLNGSIEKKEGTSSVSIVQRDSVHVDPGTVPTPAPTKLSWAIPDKLPRSKTLSHSAIHLQQQPVIRKSLPVPSIPLLEVGGVGSRFPRITSGIDGSGAQSVIAGVVQQTIADAMNRKPRPLFKVSRKALNPENPPMITTELTTYEEEATRRWNEDYFIPPW